MLRIAAAIGALLAVLYFVLPAGTFPDPVLAVADRFDKRPVRPMLFIGNSRTCYNDMPAMLRKIADSAHTKERFDIVTRALPAGTLQLSWNDAETRRLLKQSWHDVVVQAESNAQSSEQRTEQFFDYGGRLIREAQSTGGTPAVIVNWVYGEELFTGRGPGMRAWYYGRIQSDYARLSSMTGARLINVAQVWERVHAAAPELPLYSDGNHPTLQGSYLSALTLYAHLSGTDGSDVTYVPHGMSAAEAAIIRRAVGEGGDNS
jgi:hypothetical protein